MQNAMVVSPSDYGLTLLVTWCALSLARVRALVMALSLICYWVIQNLTTTNFHAFLICSSLYFYLSQVNIKFLSTFRKAFISFGVVYFLGAIDQAVYYHFDFDTYFDRIQPYLITIVNAYVLASLVDGGGRQDAGFVDYITSAFNSWLARLSLH